MVDVTSLLLTHELASAEREEALDLGRLVEVLTSGWGFFTTVTDNLAALPELAADIVPDLRAAVVRRCRATAEALQRYRSRMGFACARIGRRKCWYVLPEESLTAG